MSPCQRFSLFGTSMPTSDKATVPRAVRGMDLARPVMYLPLTDYLCASMRTADRMLCPDFDALIAICRTFHRTSCCRSIRWPTASMLHGTVWPVEASAQAADTRPAMHRSSLPPRQASPRQPSRSSQRLWQQWPSRTKLSMDCTISCAGL